MARGYAQMSGLAGPGEAIAEEGLRELRHCLAEFATFMSARAYIAGQSPSLADLVWAADLQEMARHIAEVSGLLTTPVEAWRQCIGALPAGAEANRQRASCTPAPPVSRQLLYRPLALLHGHRRLVSPRSRD